MPNLLLSISYDGSDYCGWIVQKNVRTIQGELQRAIKVITGNAEFKLIGASKTDSGVHALDQKALLTVDFEPNLDRFKKALNKALSKDVRINKISKVAETFNIRNVKQKTYKYVINDGEDNIYSQRFELKWKHASFDIDKLQNIFNLFVGKHDFKLFSGLEEDELEQINTIRIINSISVKRNSDKKIEITFKAESFIRYQIRMIIGAALEAYQNQRISVAEILEKLKGVGTKSTIVIESKGLVLEEIIYKS